MEPKKIVISKSAKRKAKAGGVFTQQVVYHTKVGKRIKSVTKHEPIYK